MAGYLGQKPTSSPLTTTDLGDGIVTNIKIADLDAAKLTGNVDIARLPAAVLNSNVATVDLAQLEMNQALLAFKIASSNQLAKFSMVDQVIDEYQDATGIDAGNSTNETAGGATTAKYYDGSVPASPSTVVKSYTGANQTFVVPSGVTTINFIAWGAAGGSGQASGSGGGGGFIEGDVAVTAGETLNVKVGGGGQTSPSQAGIMGGGGGGTGIYRSTTVLAIAGAGGGGQSNGGAAGKGGAGGGTTGGTAGVYAGAAATGGTQSAGGSGPTYASSAYSGGSLGQGGRVTDVSGSDGTGGYNGGGKGDTDNTTFTSAGGGGGYYGGSAGGDSSGSTGSGAGGSSLTAGTNTQAAASTGVVANAAHANYQAGTGNGVSGTHGQNGHAVLKYTGVTVSNLTLQSVATTAESAPTTADLVMLIEDNGSGTATINTDIKAKVSRDGSAFSSYVTLVDEGDWGTNKRILVARNIDISGITSGVAMKYKIETLNQSSGVKETRIHATSLAWA